MFLFLFNFFSFVSSLRHLGVVCAMAVYCNALDLRRKLSTILNLDGLIYNAIDLSGE